jgi:hypothetical protein
MMWNCLITNDFDETKVRDNSRGFYYMMMWAGCLKNALPALGQEGIF